jgi:exosortase
MSEVSTMPAEGDRSRSLGWMAAALLGLLVVLLYYRIGIKLARDWYDFPDYGHGMLIPFFVGFLLWERRETLRATPVKASWAGVPLVVLGLFVLLLGIFGADLFLSRISFVLLAAGLVWTLLGPAMLRKTQFMLLVLILAIPLPTLILNHITLPLQMLASQTASAILPVLHVPVLQEGNVIQLPAMPLEVAEACSGIRSLMSLLTVAIIYGYLFDTSMARRVLLALASVPIAIAANVARIVGTGLCVQYWDPDKAMGFFHEFSGFLMFLVSLTSLYLLHGVLRWMSPRAKEAV